MLSGHQTRWPNDKMLVQPICWVVQRIRTANSVVTIDTVCSRQCSLKMSASEEAAHNIDQTSSKKTPKQNARRWSDEETDRLIDLLEGNRCLWDVFCADYHLKDKRE